MHPPLQRLAVALASSSDEETIELGELIEGAQTFWE
jgi:hypothetical protein